MFVISLGGSIVAPVEVDLSFLRSFSALIGDYCASEGSHRLIFIVGGGGPARAYQRALRELRPDSGAEQQDWVGVMATRLNAELVRHLFDPLCQDPVVTDPTAEFSFGGKILVAAGWKPGFSTDFDAVVLAERFGADTVINLSNIKKVYSADPKEDATATPLDQITWTEYTTMIGETWSPGRNTPFDPVASKRAAEIGLKVIVAGGRDLANIKKILQGEEYFGTTIAS